MAATRDETCNLIERVTAARPDCAFVPPPKTGTLGTPHADALSDRIHAATAAVATLLAVGCLVDELRITPDRCDIALHRAPPGPAVRRHAQKVDARRDPAVASVEWAGRVVISWPMAYAGRS